MERTKSLKNIFNCDIFPSSVSQTNGKTNKKNPWPVTDADQNIHDILKGDTGTVMKVGRNGVIQEENFGIWENQETNLNAINEIQIVNGDITLEELISNYDESFQIYKNKSVNNTKDEKLPNENISNCGNDIRLNNESNMLEKCKDTNPIKESNVIIPQNNTDMDSMKESNVIIPQKDTDMDSMKESVIIPQKNTDMDSSRKESNFIPEKDIRTAKKRKPPNKPPRIFSNNIVINKPITANKSMELSDRKSCTNCRCDMGEHDVPYDDIISEHKMSQLSIHDANDNIMDNDHKEYLWVPSGLDDNLIEEYMKDIPLEKVPHFDNPEGIKYYNKQLIHQIPLQDSNIENINTLTQKEGHYVDAFKRERDPEMSTGVVMQATETLYCVNCNGDILEEEVYVYGEACGEESIWHPRCFVCCICNELLVNLIYCFRDNQIFCTRHHAEQIKPRCHMCDELVFCGEYIRTDETAYHSQHFICTSCECPLSGEQHLLDEGLPICIPCYDKKFASTCFKCNKTIGVDEDDVMYDKQHWHDYCLVCHLCKCKLSITSFVVKEGNFLCSDCFQRTDDKRCNVCGNGFEPGVKRLELKGEYWHDTCFVCDICKDPITSKKFIHHEGKQVCCPCFDAHFAKRCDRCKEILREGGVACGGGFFHRDCFVCESCDTSIANQAFQQKDGQRYCTPCYKQMYAKTCKGCGDYIVNGEFYTVESDNWHKQCFKCVECNDILRQQTFVQENGKIKLICEKCL